MKIIKLQRGVNTAYLACVKEEGERGEGRGLITEGGKEERRRRMDAEDGGMRTEGEVAGEEGTVC